MHFLFVALNIAHFQSCNLVKTKISAETSETQHIRHFGMLPSIFQLYELQSKLPQFGLPYLVFCLFMCATYLVALKWLENLETKMARNLKTLFYFKFKKQGISFFTNFQNHSNNTILLKLLEFQEFKIKMCFTTEKNIFC